MNKNLKINSSVKISFSMSEEASELPKTLFLFVTNVDRKQMFIRIALTMPVIYSLFNARLAKKKWKIVVQQNAKKPFI